MAMVCAHLLIRGDVQGVFYRASARDQALQLGVKGWVRNLPGGEVEAQVEGPQGPVDDFIAWCRRGPSAAEVDDVEVSQLPYKGEFQTFSVLR